MPQNLKNLAMFLQNKEEFRKTLPDGAKSQNISHAINYLGIVSWREKFLGWEKFCAAEITSFSTTNWNGLRAFAEISRGFEVGQK